MKTRWGKKIISTVQALSRTVWKSTILVLRLHQLHSKWSQPQIPQQALKTEGHIYFGFPGTQQMALSTIHRLIGDRPGGRFACVYPAHHNHPYMYNAQLSRKRNAQSFIWTHPCLVPNNLMPISDVTVESANLGHTNTSDTTWRKWLPQWKSWGSHWNSKWC